MMKPAQVVKLISYWPPFLAAGIRVHRFNLEERYIESTLKRTPFNGNIFGTHFGGSLYSMCDPWYVFLAIHFLGGAYIVWDAGAEIKYLKASKEPVFARFTMSEEDIQNIRDRTAGGKKFLATFDTQVKTKAGDVVASVRKTIYVREKQST